MNKAGLKWQVPLHRRYTPQVKWSDGTEKWYVPEALAALDDAKPTPPTPSRGAGASSQVRPSSQLYPFI